MVNVLWGLFNLAIGYLLVCRVGTFDLRKTRHVVALGAGISGACKCTASARAHLWALPLDSGATETRKDGSPSSELPKKSSQHTAIFHSSTGTTTSEFTSNSTSTDMPDVDFNRAMLVLEFHRFCPLKPVFNDCVHFVYSKTDLFLIY
jgi:hypothetical protein